jgi:hypothetical protein
MGKGKSEAASVSWTALQAAIAANPQRSDRLTTGSASASLAALPAHDVTLSWLPGWTEDTTFTISDAVSFAVWVRDPLYRTATVAVRRAMEMEEAAALLHASEAAWKQHNGRVRGWVRKHLEEDLRHRASGGDPAPDAWETIRTTKRAALLLDYICVMRGLRAALWWPEQKAVTVVPLSGVSPATPVVQMNCISGRILLGPDGFTVAGAAWPALLLTAADTTWAPPACGASIGAQTVAQIQGQLDAIAPGQQENRQGGRVGLWNRLQWARLVRALNGHEDAISLAESDTSAE